MNHFSNSSAVIKFFIPLSTIANKDEEIRELILHVIDNGYELFFANGRLALFEKFHGNGSYYTTTVNEVIFNENNNLLCLLRNLDCSRTELSSFDNKYISGDLQLGFFFKLKTKSFFGLWRNYLDCKLLFSSTSIFHQVDNKYEKKIVLCDKVDQLYCTMLSPNNNVLAVVYLSKKNEKMICEFFCLCSKEGSKCEDFSHQLDLTKIFSGCKFDSFWRIQFNSDNTLCSIVARYSAAVYSLKNRLLYTIPFATVHPSTSHLTMEHGFLINDVQHGDMFICHEKAQSRNNDCDNYIICYTIRSMSTERLLKIHLNLLGFDHVNRLAVTCFTRSIAYVSDSKSIYMIDILKTPTHLEGAVVKKIIFSDNFTCFNFCVNWTGEELAAILYKDDQYHLKIHYLNLDSVKSGRNLSLLKLARNAVLSSSSYDTLSKLNLPKTVRLLLGLR